MAKVLLSDEEAKLKTEQIKESTTAKGAFSKDLLLKTKELESIKTKELGIKKELDIFTKTKEQKQRLNSEVELIKNSIASQSANSLKLTNELQELELKELELKSMQSVKADYASLQEQLKAQEQLKEYHLKKEGLNRELIQLREQYGKSKSEITTLQKECEMYDQLVFDAKNLEQDLSIRQDNIEAKHTIEKELLAEISGEQKQIDITNEKIEKLQELGSESACPTCTRPLLEEYDNVINSLVSVVNNTHQKKIDEYKIQL